DRYYDVLAEVPRVRAELGYPPLVTPSSQFVGTQATLNVIVGERYKVIPEEIKEYIRGHYGKPPAPIDAEIQRKAIGDEKPITCRPADLLSPGWEKAKAEIGDLAKSDEDILSYALFPQIARPFLERRAKGLGGKEEFAAAIGAILFQQADEKAAKTKPVAAAVIEGSAWKMAGRAGMVRGAKRW
ncbi:MAG: oxaloacetate decarboxylase alpha subunit, partial [Candidatus Krumholzibacteriota bacterium]|nr:oxaloacetate decarboxylase alpha subunit [Candidatus Krumholzibacteriota bacterium]